MRNQAKQRSISNLMINGGTGTNGFNFHPSPRMVCFLCRLCFISNRGLYPSHAQLQVPQFLEPELRFLQMPIGDVPRGVSEGVNQEPMRHPIRMKAPKGGSSSVTPPDSSETREANRATMYQVVQRALYADTSTMNPQQQDVHWKMILGLQKDLGL